MISCSHGGIAALIARGGTGSRHRRSRMPVSVWGCSERLLARRELVEQDPQRIEVAARIAAVVLQLLGRHVRRRARGEVLLLAEKIGVVRVPRETEVEQHGLAGRSEHDVFRLEVEMDDVLRVHALDRVGELGADPGDLVGRQRSLHDDAGERRAFDPLHDDVRRCGHIARRDESRHVADRQAWAESSARPRSCRCRASTRPGRAGALSSPAETRDRCRRAPRSGRSRPFPPCGCVRRPESHRRLRPGSTRSCMPRKRSDAQFDARRQRARQTGVADLRGGGSGVVGHAVEGDLPKPANRTAHRRPPDCGLAAARPTRRSQPSACGRAPESASRRQAGIPSFARLRLRNRAPDRGRGRKTCRLTSAASAQRLAAAGLST